MAGVRDELILDISKAQRSIDALEAQISSAFSSLSVDVDTAGISQEITRAVDAADTSTRIEVDTAGISTEISSAVDRADTDVKVNADTTAARREVQALDREIDKTTSSASGLGGVLTGAALIAAGRGLFGLAEAASAVNEQVTGSEIVFDNLAGSVQRFADQADRIGLGEAQALQLSNTFGQLAISAGLSDQAVADFATTIVQRGADIASLRDIDLSQTLDALRSGLVGETEPLRNVGIFINEAAVQTEAYRLGLANLGDELNDQQKIQARYSLILQQSEIAAGNFALTQDGLANKQRQVGAAFKDLAADAGTVLEPTFLNLANLAEEHLIPQLAKLGEEALPAIGQILEDLAPLLGVTVDLLIAGAPILQLIADVISIIPTPLLAGAGAWLAFQKAQKLATGTEAAHKVDVMATKVGELGRALLQETGGRIGLGRGLGLTAAVAGLVAITTTDAGSDIGALAGSIIKLGDSLTGFGSRRETNIKGQLEDLIGGLDLNKLDESQIAIRRLTDDLGELDEAVGKGRLFSLGDVNVFATGGDAARQERIDQIREQVDALNKQAFAEGEAGLATGRWTDAQAAAAFTQAAREKPASIVIRQLELLREEEERNARNSAGIIDKYKGIAAQYVETADAAGRLRDAAPEVESAVAGIRGAGGGDQTFLTLATAIDTANLSADGMADTAALLGTDVEHLTGFVEATTSALNEFIDTAVGGLPSVSDAFEDALADAQAAAESTGQGIRDAADQQGQAIIDSADQRAQAIIDAAADQIAAAGKDLSDADARSIREGAQDRAAAIRDGATDEADAIRDGGETRASAIEDAARVTARGLTDSLASQAAAIADFRHDLDQLSAAGFVDLAGLLAEQGLETGDALADELTTALDQGNVALLEGLRTANQQFKDESLATVDFITNELGPEVLSASGLLASAITDSFGDNLDFEEKVRIAAALAKSTLDSQGKQIAAIAAVEGEDAAREYGAALKLDEHVIQAGIDAGNAINGVSSVPFQLTGERLGDALATGFVDGMTLKQDEVDTKAAQLALAAKHAMERELEVQSPSKVAQRIGLFVGEGLAAGIDQSSASAVRASVRTASQVAGALGSQVPAFGVRSTTSSGGGIGRLHPDDIAALAAALAGQIPAGGETINITETTSARATARSVIARTRDLRRRTG